MQISASNELLAHITQLAYRASQKQTISDDEINQIRSAIEQGVNIDGNIDAMEQNLIDAFKLTVETAQDGTTQVSSADKERVIENLRNLAKAYHLDPLDNRVNFDFSNVQLKTGGSEALNSFFSSFSFSWFGDMGNAMADILNKHTLEGVDKPLEKNVIDGLKDLAGLKDELSALIPAGTSDGPLTKLQSQLQELSDNPFNKELFQNIQAESKALLKNKTISPEQFQVITKLIAQTTKIEAQADRLNNITSKLQNERYTTQASPAELNQLLANKTTAATNSIKDLQKLTDQYMLRLHELAANPQTAPYINIPRLNEILTQLPQQPFTEKHDILLSELSATLQTWQNRPPDNPITQRLAKKGVPVGDLQKIQAAQRTVQAAVDARLEVMSELNYAKESVQRLADDSTLPAQVKEALNNQLKALDASVEAVGQGQQVPESALADLAVVTKAMNGSSFYTLEDRLLMETQAHLSTNQSAEQLSHQIAELLQSEQITGLREKLLKHPSSVRLPAGLKAEDLSEILKHPEAFCAFAAQKNDQQAQIMLFNLTQVLNGLAQGDSDSVSASYAVMRGEDKSLTAGDLVTALKDEYTKFQVGQGQQTFEQANPLEMIAKIKDLVKSGQLDQFKKFLERDRFLMKGLDPKSDQGKLNQEFKDELKSLLENPDSNQTLAGMQLIFEKLQGIERPNAPEIPQEALDRAPQLKQLLFNALGAFETAAKSPDLGARALSEKIFANNAMTFSQDIKGAKELVASIDQCDNIHKISEMKSVIEENFKQTKEAISSIETVKKDFQDLQEQTYHAGMSTGEGMEKLGNYIERINNSESLSAKEWEEVKELVGSEFSQTKEMIDQLNSQPDSEEKTQALSILANKQKILETVAPLLKNVQDSHTRLDEAKAQLKSSYEGMVTAADKSIEIITKKLDDAKAEVPPNPDKIELLESLVEQNKVLKGMYQRHLELLNNPNVSPKQLQESASELSKLQTIQNAEKIISEQYDEPVKTEKLIAFYSALEDFTNKNDRLPNIDELKVIAQQQFKGNQKAERRFTEEQESIDRASDEYRTLVITENETDGKTDGNTDGKTDGNPDPNPVTDGNATHNKPNPNTGKEEDSNADATTTETDDSINQWKADMRRIFRGKKQYFQRKQQESPEVQKDLNELEKQTNEIYENAYKTVLDSIFKYLKAAKEHNQNVQKLKETQTDYQAAFNDFKNTDFAKLFAEMTGKGKAEEVKSQKAVEETQETNQKPELKGNESKILLEQMELIEKRTLELLEKMHQAQKAIEAIESTGLDHMVAKSVNDLRHHSQKLNDIAERAKSIIKRMEHSFQATKQETQISQQSSTAFYGNFAQELGHLNQDLTKVGLDFSESSANITLAGLDAELAQLSNTIPTASISVDAPAFEAVQVSFGTPATG